MHDSAYKIGSEFLAIYAQKAQCVIVEIGALDVNGSLRDARPANATYLGLDYHPGNGVDIIVRPGEPLPLDSNFADVVISTSQMEHDPEFWTTLIELFRIVKTNGFIYISSPSNGGYHAYPLDAWRFYPDAGKAFAALGRKNDYPMTLLESFTARRMSDQWNDFVCVLVKGEWSEGQDWRYLSDVFDSYNVWKFGAKEILRLETLTEDQYIAEALRHEISGLNAGVAQLKLGSEDCRSEVTGLQSKIAHLRSEISSLQSEVGRLQAKIVKASERRLKRRAVRAARKLLGGIPPLLEKVKTALTRRDVLK